MVIVGKAYSVLILQESTDVMADSDSIPHLVKPSFDYGEHSFHFYRKNLKEICTCSLKT